MPLVGLDSYCIDFSILTTDDPKTIVLFDQSNYLSIPEKPIVEVILPGFTGNVQFSYEPSTLIVLNSTVLNLTFSDTCALADLPDGVYQITLRVCPYDELFKKRCYLKTTQLECEYEKLLLELDVVCGCLDPKDIKEEVIDIDILIQSARAEARRCNVERATSKYRIALKKVQNLNKKLNCR